MNITLTVLLTSAMIPAAAAGQTLAGSSPAPAPGQRAESVVISAVETRITPGRPYSAEAVTETTQVLPDGNRIHQVSRTRTFRDAEGRTRREMYGSDGTLRTVGISDPVAGVAYTLDPVNKVAAQTGNVMAPRVQAPVRIVQGNPLAPDMRPRTTAPAVIPGEALSAGAIARTPAPDHQNVSREDLGTQNIEGVLATGTRTTTIIPPGEVGNAQELRIVSERWFSDELQVLVMTRHADPRSGETTYRLKNILRADPDPALFTVPPDYSIRARAIRRPE